jgi:hypothetical protein
LQKTSCDDARYKLLQCIQHTCYAPHYPTATVWIEMVCPTNSQTTENKLITVCWITGGCTLTGLYLIGVKFLQLDNLPRPKKNLPRFQSLLFFPRMQYQFLTRNKIPDCHHLCSRADENKTSGIVIVFPTVPERIFFEEIASCNRKRKKSRILIGLLGKLISASKDRFRKKETFFLNFTCKNVN